MVGVVRAPPQIERVCLTTRAREGVGRPRRGDIPSFDELRGVGVGRPTAIAPAPARLCRRRTSLAAPAARSWRRCCARRPRRSGARSPAGGDLSRATAATLSAAAELEAAQAERQITRKDFFACEYGITDAPATSRSIAERMPNSGGDRPPSERWSHAARSLLSGRSRCGRLARWLSGAYACDCRRSVKPSSVGAKPPPAGPRKPVTPFVTPI